MIGSSRSYAIGMAHYQLAGGWKVMLAVCAGYLVLFLCGLGVYLYADYASAPMGAGVRTGLTTAAISALTVFETFALLLYGSHRVAACIRLDVTSKMIESHRLMPVSAWRAVTGYMLGGGAHALAFAAVNVGLAAALGAIIGTSFLDIMIKQVFLLSFTMLIWSSSAMATFVARHAHTIILALLVVGGCFGVYGAFVMLPGLSFLATPLFQETVFSFGSPGAFSVSYPLSVLCQLGFIALFFVAACRGYRGTYRLMFPTAMGLGLVLLWSLTSVFGQVYWEQYSFVGMRRFREAGIADGQAGATVMAAMLLAFVPLRSIVAEQKKGVGVLVTAGGCLLTSVLIAGGALGSVSVGNRATAESFLITWLMAGAFVVGVYALLTILKGKKPLVQFAVVLAALVFMWVGPLLLEMLSAIALARTSGEVHFGMFGNWSPIGLMINTWGVDSYYARGWGIGVQWVEALVLLGVAGLLWVRRAGKLAI